MGILTRMIKTGITAGAAYAALKVAEKYKANNPEGVDDSRKYGAIKEAAEEVYQQAAAFAKEKAPGVMDTVSAAAKQATEIAKAKAPDFMAKVQSAAETVSVKAQEFADSLANELVDAEFTPAEEEKEENKEE